MQKRIEAEGSLSKDVSRIGVVTRFCKQCEKRHTLFTHLAAVKIEKCLPIVRFLAACNPDPLEFKFGPLWITSYAFLAPKKRKHGN